MGVPYTFGTATTSIPLSQLDANFNTPVTLGNTTVGLGNTVTTVGNLTLTNVNITSGTINSAVVVESYALANAVVYSDAVKDGTTSANLTFNGTTFAAINDASISGLTVGKGKGGAGDTNTVVGADIFSSSVSGNRNSAFGRYALGNLSSGSDNTGLGFAAGYQITTGANNTSVGKDALYSNTTASNNTAVGYQALYSNTASENTAVGYLAGYSNVSGTGSTFIGLRAGQNSTAGDNTAIGFTALRNNTSGTHNVAVGGGVGGVANGVLASNTTGSYNTAMGDQALTSNTTASFNTALGYQAGYTTTTQISNTFVGTYAGYSSAAVNNTFIGTNSGYQITSGAKNTIIGSYQGNGSGLDIRTASNYIVLSDGDGNPRVQIDGSGNMLVTPGTIGGLGTYNNTTASAANVNILSSGVMVRSTSALKYKTDIRDLPSIDIKKFRPIVYKSKSLNDDQTKDHFGIIADEVHDAGITELVNYGVEGEVEGFQYERLTVVLLKELQTLKADFEAYKASHP
jgi:hypothetical protein